MKFKIGDKVRKIKGSQWSGKVVGYYSTDLTPVGYCVESQFEKGSVQIYPESALELINNDEEKTTDLESRVSQLEAILTQITNRNNRLR